MEEQPVSPDSDRLEELLSQHQCLYGMICRDITLTDIELMAIAGYHIVWIDLEHSQASADQLRAVFMTARATGLGQFKIGRAHV
mgnify:CR=1 FL=1